MRYTPLIIFALLLLGAAGAFWLWRQTQEKTRTRLLATPLTPAQRALVTRQVPLTQRLPRALRSQLEGKINRFLQQIEFIGCAGLQVTEEMRLSIAAQACLLIVNSNAWYDHLRTILVYPGAFRSRLLRQQGHIVSEQDTIRSGESWPRGPVVLSWSHSQEGARNDHDGHNVVLHEFAHQLDHLSGHTDGAPNLQRGQSLAVWAQVFLDAYERHVQQVAQGHKTFFDPYAAQGPEEFFAVAVETFFEKPGAFQRKEPEVYAQLVTLLQLDPSSWG